MPQITNPGPLEIIATAHEGRDYRIAPGETIDVEGRAALSLVQGYGAKFVTTDDRLAALEDLDGRAPLDAKDTNHADPDRQHRIDDERANVAGTPLEETGATASPYNTAAVENGGDLETVDTPGVPATTTKGRGRRTRVVDDTTSQPPVETGSQEGAAAAQTSDALATPDLSTETGVTKAVEAAVAAEEAAAAGGPPLDLSWIDGLRGQQLDNACSDVGISPIGKDLAAKRAALREYIEGHAHPAGA